MRSQSQIRSLHFYAGRIKKTTLDKPLSNNRLDFPFIIRIHSSFTTDYCIEGLSTLTTLREIYTAENRHCQIKFQYSKQSRPTVPQFKSVGARTMEFTQRRFLEQSSLCFGRSNVYRTGKWPVFKEHFTAFALTQISCYEQ